MSTIVKSVYDALKSEVTTVLGSSYEELRFLFNIENNDLRTANKAFGIIPLGAANNPTILKSYTLDQEFEIILCRTNTREIDDTDTINALLDASELYDSASEIFKTVLNKQLGIPTIVHSVSSPNIDAPEILENLIILRLQVTVKWRESLV